MAEAAPNDGLQRRAQRVRCMPGVGGTLYHGTVSEVLPATASSFALLPASDRSTANFTKVTQRIAVHIDIGSTSRSALYPGENAAVRIRTT